MTRFIIYGLHDPTTGELRYVGKSCCGIRRPQQHSTPKSLTHRSPKSSWIKSLRARGLKPDISILEEMDNSEQLGDVERLAIAHYRSMRFRLTNMADGGPGAYGVIKSAETREKIAASKRGKKRAPFTAEHIANISAAGRGTVKPRTPEHAAKIGAALRGRTLSPEMRAKLSIAHTGRRLTPETIEKIRLSKIGKKRAPFSPEWCAKLATWTGRKHTAETKAKISAANFARATRERAASS